MTSKYLILILLVSIFGTGCYKDFDDTESTDHTPLPKVIFTTKMSGSVTDNTGQLQSDYTLNWGINEIDVTGKHFIVELPLIDQLDNTIWAEKDGEKIGFIHLPMMANDVNYGVMQQFSDWKNQDINTNETIDIAENTTITTSPTDFNSNNLRYREIENANNIVHHGYTANGRLLALEDVSVFQLDLPDPKSGAKAEVNINNEYQLLKLDEDRDKWIKPLETEITEDGYYLIAKIEFGITAQGSIVNDDVSLSYQWYKLNDQTSRSTARGRWIKVLPQNSTIITDLLDPCLEKINEQLLTTDTEPIVQNLEVGPDAIIQSIQTEIIDCEGQLTNDNSVIQITETTSDQTLYFFSSSEIDINIPVCNENFSIAAYDIATEETGLSIPWNTEIGDDITYLSTCESFASGHSIYKIRDITKVYGAFTLERENNKLILQSSDGNMKLVLQNDMKGEYPIEEVNIKIYDENFGDKGYSVTCENSPVGCGIDDCFVSHLDQTDELVRVTFSGDIWMQTINPATASTYKVEGMIICQPN